MLLGNASDLGRDRPLDAGRRPPRSVAGLAALIWLALLAVFGGAQNSSASHGGQHKCLPQGAKTVLLGRQGRIYAHKRGPYQGYRQLWACLFASGATSRLTDGAWFPPPAMTWSGAVVGWADTDIEENLTEITLADLSRPPTGRGPFVSVALRESEAKVGSLRITQAGGVAWIECPQRGRYSDPETYNRPIVGWGDPRPNCTRPGRSVNSVFKHDSTDRRQFRRLLDRGRSIDPRSLRLRGSTLTWRKNGRRRTATLK